MNKNDRELIEEMTDKMEKMVFAMHDMADAIERQQGKSEAEVQQSREEQTDPYHYSDKQGNTWGVWE